MLMSIIKLTAATTFLQFKHQISSLLFDFRTCQPKPQKRILHNPFPMTRSTTCLRRLRRSHKREYHKFGL